MLLIKQTKFILETYLIYLHEYDTKKYIWPYNYWDLYTLYTNNTLTDYKNNLTKLVNNTDKSVFYTLRKRCIQTTML